MHFNWKGFAATVAFLAAASAAHAQCWIKEHSGSATASAPTRDGGIIAAGESIYKFDKSGELTWSKEFPADFKTGKPSVTRVITSANSGYLIAGSFYSGIYKDIFLYKIDEDGKELWRKTYGGAKHDVLASVREWKDGGLIILGSVYPEVTAKEEFDERMHLIRTNEKGELIWEKTLDDSLAVGRDILQLKDGSFLVAGNLKKASLQMDGWEQEASDVMLMKLSAKGEPQWKKTYPDESELFIDYSYALSVIQTADGNFILAGFGYGIEYETMPVIKVDGKGNVIWKKYHTGSARSVLEVSDGYIVPGTIYFWISDDSEKEGNMSLVKIDKDGNRVWEKYKGDETMGTDGLGVIPVKDGYLLIGSSNGFEDTKRLYIQRLDIAGCPD